ncbi:MAG: DUF938 domain-containing protein [Pseudomonadota bacterium]
MSTTGKPSLNIPFSQACERNKDAILDVIRPHLVEAKTVLEVGSGTGQHAVYFARNLPHLSWQTSDQKIYLEGVAAQLANCFAEDQNNALSPIELDVLQDRWLKEESAFDAVYTANTLHIMDWETVQAFFRGLPQVTRKGSKLIIYGPFKYQGEFTSASNGVFDQSLRVRGVGSAIRDFGEVDKLAQEQGFAMLDDVSMPANNQCIIWQCISVNRP